MKHGRPLLLLALGCFLAVGACGEFEDEPNQIQQALNVSGVGTETGGSPSGLGETPSGDPSGLGGGMVEGGGAVEGGGGLGEEAPGGPTGIQGAGGGGGGLSGGGGSCSGVCQEVLDCFPDLSTMAECLEVCGEALHESPDLAGAAAECVMGAGSCEEMLPCLDYEDDGHTEVEISVVEPVETCELSGCVGGTFDYSCASGSFENSLSYCPNGGNVSSATVSYDNGHTVTCTFNCSGMGGSCSDDTGASCTLQ